MKILLTGGEGFTGKAFLGRAASVGHKVIALQADLTDKQSLAQEVLEIQPDSVLHLAAISYVAHADELAFYAVNMMGTINLLDALCALPICPSKVVLASSANVYGNCAASPIKEDQPPAPVNHYAMSKLAMEHMARTFASRLPIVITRPFNYTGPGQLSNFLIPKLVDHFARRAPNVAIGNLAVEREFNDVQMISDAYLQLLEHGVASEVYNVCSGRPHTLNHVIDTLQSITGHHIEVRVDPALVRANDVHSLCGDPAKLDALLASRGASLINPPLALTLKRMLDAAAR